jgi:hypothetical protein
MMQTTTSDDEPNQPTNDSLLPASNDTPSSSSTMPITDSKLDDTDPGTRQGIHKLFKKMIYL